VSPLRAPFIGQFMLPCTTLASDAFGPAVSRTGALLLLKLKEMRLLKSVLLEDHDFSGRLSLDASHSYSVPQQYKLPG
jgi:hypothetical protein